VATLAYQITRYGVGFNGRKQRLLRTTLARLNRHLWRVSGPYTINGEGKFTRKEVVAEVGKRFRAHPNAQFKVVVAGDKYDQPAWALRSVEKLQTTSPLVRFGEQYVGRSQYLFAADGPPGPSDCSGFTQHCVQHVYGVTLAHSADLQSQDGRIDHFHDPADLQNGDFVFLNYGRLAWPHADHVEFYVGPGKTLGSRPSTDGVNFYNFGAYDSTRVITYGRWRT
jgi:cell wall-associated NlpC family hydrolase